MSSVAGRASRRTQRRQPPPCLRPARGGHPSTPALTTPPRPHTLRALPPPASSRNVRSAAPTSGREWSTGSGRMPTYQWRRTRRRGTTSERGSCSPCAACQGGRGELAAARGGARRLWRLSLPPPGARLPAPLPPPRRVPDTTNSPAGPPWPASLRREHFSAGRPAKGGTGTGRGQPPTTPPALPPNPPPHRVLEGQHLPIVRGDQDVRGAIRVPVKKQGGRVHRGLVERGPAQRLRAVDALRRPSARVGAFVCAGAAGAVVATQVGNSARAVAVAGSHECRAVRLPRRRAQRAPASAWPQAPSAPGGAPRGCARLYGRRALWALPAGLPGSAQRMTPLCPSGRRCTGPSPAASRTRWMTPAPSSAAPRPGGTRWGCHQTWVAGDDEAGVGGRGGGGGRGPDGMASPWRAARAAAPRAVPRPSRTWRGRTRRSLAGVSGTWLRRCTSACRRCARPTAGPLRGARPPA